MKRLALVLLLAACGGKSAPAPTTPVSNTPPSNVAAEIDALGAIEARACECTDAACATHAQSDEQAWQKRQVANQASDEQQQDEADLEAQISDCVAGATAKPIAVDACNRYVDEMHVYISCPKVTQDQRDAAAQGLKAMQDGLASMGDAPEEARKSMNDACAQANDALAQAITALGCAP